MAQSWPLRYRKEVGLRLKALTLAALRRERDNGRKMSKKAFLYEARVSDTAWANYETGTRPTDGWEVRKFTQRWGGTFEWIFANEIKSISDSDLQRRVWECHQKLLQENQQTHAA